MDDDHRTDDLRPIHFARVPFAAVCGANAPNQSTTAVFENATCHACKSREWQARRAAVDLVLLDAARALIAASPELGGLDTQRDRHDSLSDRLYRFVESRIQVLRTGEFAPWR